MGIVDTQLTEGIGHVYRNRYIRDAILVAKISDALPYTVSKYFCTVAHSCKTLAPRSLAAL